MKILTAKQTREADAYTIDNEPIASIDLMERASRACCDFIQDKFDSSHTIAIVAGNGNNGGDGLAIGRLLHKAGYSISILVQDGEKPNDCAINLSRIKEIPEIGLTSIYNLDSFDIIIDAIFGTGLTRPVDGVFADTIHAINKADAITISIDIPSGLMTEDNRQNDGAIVHADLTLTFQAPKLAFFFRKNNPYLGDFEVLDIGLHKEYIASIPSNIYFTNEINLDKHIRSKHAYKNQFGHAYIIAGSENMMGAAILCSKACLNAGTGLLTMNLPSSRANAAFSAIPEAMQIHRDTFEIPEKCNVIAIGPGIGNTASSINLVSESLESNKQLILDADALNIIAEHGLLTKIPKGTIITPHVGEFDRLFGHHGDDYVRLMNQIEYSKSYGLIIVLKGAYTSISLPSGKVYFNSTGNPYMATGGAGDVLTGVIAGFVAQGYSPEEASINAVYIHGLAGDLSHADKFTICASDIANAIPKAIKNSI